ncbi:hypothetical protein HaLaN_21410 [Haematococcus lacustris]|uniref:Uncharacterized protein n=1 Tax=Haematococcus lacustris TaxID=44745 RepID=A0A699ZLT3_HAELA|nr:hypothetical protein HaLaN_21410 [Haematococcus lacustris]
MSCDEAGRARLPNVSSEQSVSAGRCCEQGGASGSGEPGGMRRIGLHWAETGEGGQCGDCAPLPVVESGSTSRNTSCGDTMLPVPVRTSPAPPPGFNSQAVQTEARGDTDRGLPQWALGLQRKEWRQTRPSRARVGRWSRCLGWPGGQGQVLFCCGHRQLTQGGESGLRRGRTAGRSGPAHHLHPGPLCQGWGSPPGGVGGRHGRMGWGRWPRGVAQGVARWQAWVPAGSGCCAEEGLAGEKSSWEVGGMVRQGEVGVGEKSGRGMPVAVGSGQVGWVGWGAGGKGGALGCGQLQRAAGRLAEVDPASSCDDEDSQMEPGAWWAMSWAWLAADAPVTTWMLLWHWQLGVGMSGGEGLAGLAWGACRPAQPEFRSNMRKKKKEIVTLLSQRDRAFFPFRSIVLWWAAQA